MKNNVNDRNDYTILNHFKN